MEYRHLALSCQCGEVPFHIEELGFTEDHQLVIHWWCAKCQRSVYVSKPLAECWRECPQPAPRKQKQAPAAPKAHYGTQDIEFLGAMGIKLT
jgi:hypothetical protein